MAKTFGELEVYQLALELDESIWRLRAQLRNESPRLWDQLDGSAGSVADNIAEGFGRETRADFRNFLRFSRGSLHEAQSQIKRAGRRGLLAKDLVASLEAWCERLSVRLKNFQNYLMTAERSSSSYEVREPMPTYEGQEPALAPSELPSWWPSSSGE